jgi:serine/threonine protein kinase
MDTQKIARPLEPGQVVGRYQIIKRLATGGMAEIYIACVHGVRGFEKHVVLKRILPQYAEDESFVRMFLNEAKVAASLDHPNIGSVHDFGEFEGGYFFAMEYLHGEDMRRILIRSVNKNLEFPINLVLTVGIGIAAGLHFAHEKIGTDGKPLKIVHRDVSPSNIIVTYDGSVKLVDFGIAKAATQAELTGQGMVKGKSGYMSPEQCRGLAVDQRSDVFSLGIVLYELSAQRRLFKGESELDSIKMIVGTEAPHPSESIPGFPARLEEIILKALERDVAKRYQTARELGSELEEFAQESGFAASPLKLGEWMTTVFGPKPEPWQTGEQNIAEKDPDECLTTPIPQDEILSVPVCEPMLPWRPSSLVRDRRKVIGIVAALAVLAIVFSFIMVRAIKVASKPDRIETNVTVLTEGHVRTFEADAPPPAPVEIAKISPPTSLALPPKNPPAVKKPKKILAAPRAHGLAQSFSVHEREIQKCLESSLSEKQTETRVSIRFRINALGKVTTAEVLPAEIASTPLGTCLQNIALQTRFPERAETAVFTIPITVKRIATAP